MSTAFKVTCLATGFKSEIQQVVQVDLLRTRELGRAELCPLSLCYLITSSTIRRCAKESVAAATPLRRHLVKSFAFL